MNCRTGYWSSYEIDKKNQRCSFDNCKDWVIENEYENNVRCNTELTKLDSYEGILETGKKRLIINLFF